MAKWLATEEFLFSLLGKAFMMLNKENFKVWWENSNKNRHYIREAQKQKRFTSNVNLALKNLVRKH